MAEAGLLDRAQEALGKNLPEVLITAPETAEQPQLIADGDEIVARSREWTNRLQEIIAAVRVHPDANALETWSELRPLISARIARREGHIGQLEAIRFQARKIKDHSAEQIVGSLSQVIKQLSQEHRALVDIYYGLKADADDISTDARGGPSLSTPAAIDDFFDRLLASK